MSGHIVAMGGGGFSMEDSPLLDDYVLGLAAPDPRVVFLPTASGDASDYIARFYRAFAPRRCRPIHLELFRRSGGLDEIVAGAGVIYVGGGSTANMMALWRLHGLDALLRAAWERGAVLAGVSAGAVCWFESAVTDSFGPELAALDGCLGLIAGSFCPHYDGEARRRPAYREMVASGALAAGIACDDGAAVHFAGSELLGAVSSRRGAGAYRVEPGAGEAIERPIPTRFLGG